MVNSRGGFKVPSKYQASWFIHKSIDFRKLVHGNNLRKKRGWFKVFEATFACLLLLGVFFFVFKTGVGGAGLDEDINAIMLNSLNNIDLNDSVRSAILAKDQGVVEDYFSNQIGPFLNYSITICPLGVPCLGEESEKNVFSMTRIVSANLSTYDPKQLNLQIWEN